METWRVSDSLALELSLVTEPWLWTVSHGVRGEGGAVFFTQHVGVEYSLADLLQAVLDPGSQVEQAAQSTEEAH